MTVRSSKGRWRWSHRSLVIACGLAVQLYSVHRFLLLLVFMTNDGGEGDGQHRHGERSDVEDGNRGFSPMGIFGLNNDTAYGALDLQESLKGGDSSHRIQEKDFEPSASRQASRWNATSVRRRRSGDEKRRDEDVATGEEEGWTDHSATASASASASDAVVARNASECVGGNIEAVSWVKFHNESENDLGSDRRWRCRLMEEFGLRYLGCGMDGRIYEANLECHGDGGPPSRTGGGGGEDEGSAVEGSRQMRRWGRTVRVAIKVFTRKADAKARGAGPRVFANVSDDSILRGRELYRRLMMPAGGTDTTIITTTRVDEARAARLDGHFVIALGTVTFPLKMLRGKRGHCANYKMIDEITTSGTYPTGRGTTESPSPAWITGNVLPLLSGRPLGEKFPGPRGNRRYELLDPATRRGIIRDMIYIHRHMFRSGVVHCDMSLWHFHHSPSPVDRTALIDFERYKYDNAHNSGKLLAGQLWQLLANVAQICDPGGVALFDIPSNVCGGRWDRPSPEDVIPKLIAAFDKCGFDRNMTWREGDMLNNAAVAYEALADWSGIFD